MWIYSASKINNACSGPSLSHTPPLSKKHSSKKSLKNGFSLVELMMAIGIVGILAAVAVPSYINFTRNGDVADALATLMNLSTQLEKRFVDLGNYGTSGCGITIPNNTSYTFSCTLDDGFTLTASSGGDTPDYKYTIIQSGARETLAFAGGDPESGNENCWQISSSGSCF